MRHNQNRRSRGRNNRKGPNPLARSYESNGPDVKVRGTAAHVAEKYMSLARDAQAAGDIVAVESYLQHAEHYNRIVMAAQAQLQQAQQQYRESEEGYDDERQANGRRFDYNGEGRMGGEEDDRFDAADEDGGDDRLQQPRPPRTDDQYRQRGPRQDRYGFRDRQDRDRGDRPDRGERQERGERRERYEEREPQQEAVAQAEPQRAEPQPVAVEEQEAAPAPAPRRRRARRPEAAPADEARGEEATSDGAQALAAFRSES